MKIIGILQDKKPKVSFEVFPPKTDSSFESVRVATEEIASLNPAFMSVTYGAGGGTSKYTLDIAKEIKDKYSVPSVAHLTCVSSTKEIVCERIKEIKEAGIANIMALRGDIPRDGADYPRDYRYAYQLIEEIRRFDADFCIGGACYPEIHPESKSGAEDLTHLKEKVDCGLDFLTTQMFFDNAIYYSFLSKAEKCGINIPILPGVMPITSVMQIDRVVALSGSFFPVEFLNMVDKYGKNPEDMKRAGIDYATRQIINLFENGVTNMHVYSMNKPEVAKAILNNISNIIA